MRIRVLTPFAVAVLLLVSPMAASSVTIDWVKIGNPGNRRDALANCSVAACGAVSYEYWIGKYEVTNAQYVEFLNAKAASDPLALYNPHAATDTNGGITRSGSDGSYVYAVKPGFENKPVNYVLLYDAMRFTNWLHNGQGSGDTETGAYTLLGGTPTPSNAATITRNPDAITFVTSENEWYKAAYFDPASGRYQDYPTGPFAFTNCVGPSDDTGNAANCWSGFLGTNGALTDVGAYTLSASPYGTFDQGGNVWEMNENRTFRGGDSYNGYLELAASLWLPFGTSFPHVESGSLGFRVASIVPEPSTALLLAGGLLAFGRRRRPL